MADLGIPTDSSELWRYSRIGELSLDKYSLPSSVDSGSESVELSPVVDAIGPRAALIVTNNGRVVRCDVDETYASKGLRVASAATWVDDFEIKNTTTPVDLFTSLNEAFCQDPLIIDVPAGLFVEHPIVVMHQITADKTAVFPRVIIRGGEASEATVCECIVGAQVDSLVVPLTELELGQATNLRYVNVQNLETKTWQIAYQVSQLAQDATLQSTSVALGGDYARVRTDSRLDGKGSTAKLNALYFGNESQMHDFRTLQEHVAGKTVSELLFKGAVGDSSRSVYSGLIKVHKGAAGTNAFQTNRNLVLSEGARADSVPNLEIEEHDVRCSHASAVGPVDEDQRYYLESRGVPTNAAERLIVLGFLDEVVSGISIPGLQQFLQELVADKLREIGIGVK